MEKMTEDDTMRFLKRPTLIELLNEFKNASDTERHKVLSNYTARDEWLYTRGWTLEEYNDQYKRQYLKYD